MNVAEVLNTRLETLRAAGQRSAINAPSVIKALVPFFGERDAADVSRDSEALAEKYQDRRMAMHMKPSTIDGELRFLKAALKRARLEFTFAPLQAFGDNARSTFLPKEHWNAFLAAVADDDSRDALEWALCSGWRVGEIGTLRWENVDLARGTVTMPGARKGRRARTRFVKNEPVWRTYTLTSDRQRAIIQRRHDKQADGLPVFHVPAPGRPAQLQRALQAAGAAAAAVENALSHQPISRNRGNSTGGATAVFEAAFKAAAKAMLSQTLTACGGQGLKPGVERLHLHDLRRSYRVEMDIEYSGLSREAAASAMSHETEAMSQRYLVAEALRHPTF
jgi:integrase